MCRSILKFLVIEAGKENVTPYVVEVTVLSIQDDWIWVGVWSEFSSQPLTVLSVSLTFLLQMYSHLVRYSISSRA